MRPKDLETYLQFVFTHPEEKFVPCISGAPGVGKSDIVTGAAEAAGMELLLSHPVTSDPTDYKGLPCVVDGGAEFLPFGDLNALVNAKIPTVFFLDDAGQASNATQAALMQLVLARQVNGHKISSHVQFVMATNRRQDRGGVSGILEPLKGRAQMITLQPDLSDWITWAAANDMPPDIMAFCNFRPNFLFDPKPTTAMVNSSNPRTIAAVGRHVTSELPADLEYPIFTGCAGEGFATEYIGFRKVYKEIPNPQHILLRPSEVPVPDSTKPAVLYAISGALAHIATPDNFDRVAIYADRMPVEFNILLVRDALKRHPRIDSTPAFIKWGAKHIDVML
jgi:hypothetical protein